MADMMFGGAAALVAENGGTTADTGTTGGDSSLIGTLMNFAMATGADGLFVEVHPDPMSSPSDKESMLQLHLLEPLLRKAAKLREAAE